MITGATPDVGARVNCLPYHAPGGQTPTISVIGTLDSTVMRTNVANAALSENLAVASDSIQAFKVRSSAGTSRLIVDNVNKYLSLHDASGFRVYNAAGSLVASIDGATGAGVLASLSVGGVPAADVNSIVIDSAVGVSTTSSTDTVNLATRLSKSITLPTGTYDLTVQWDAEVKHSVASGVVRVEFQRGSAVAGAIESAPQSTADTYRTFGQNLSQTGLSGTVVFEIKYRPVTAGTATVTSGRILVIGKRV